ncbi:transglutaminase domain-containing protein [Massilia sp. UMI-21]|nr:transglutaminase domain-containing protein [Massilia sp. UMI-21]
MKKLIVLLLLAAHASLGFAQSGRTHLSEKIDIASLNLRSLGEEITKNAGSDYQKATLLLDWVSNRLAWLATDYQRRTVAEILERGGGNCYELAQVYLALVQEMHIKSRPIAEVNLSRHHPERQVQAEQLVEEKGVRYSLFGARHNDHRWLEVHDEASGQWLPVDPTMNVIGVDRWVKARLGFGKRVSIDPAISDDMIAPFAIFVTDDSKTRMIDNRSAYYMVEQFDKAYDNKLSKLPSWNRWVGLIDSLSRHARSAFESQENFHLQTKQIDELDAVYRDLKAEYLKSRTEAG